MNSEALYREVETFKTGGTPSSKEIKDLYKKKELYKSRGALRVLSGIIYFLFIVFILLSFFYAPVRSFVLSFLKLNVDLDNIASGSFWKIRGVVFLISIIANCFLCYSRAPFVGEAVIEAFILGLFSLGTFLSPYLVLLGLFLSFCFSFDRAGIDGEIKKAEAKRKKELFEIALTKDDMKLVQLLAEIQCEEAANFLEMMKEFEKHSNEQSAGASSASEFSWDTGVVDASSPALNTYMTISGTDEFVYYKNGEYVDSNGNTVPKNRIED